MEWTHERLRLKEELFERGGGMEGCDAPTGTVESAEGAINYSLEVYRGFLPVIMISGCHVWVTAGALRRFQISQNVPKWQITVTLQEVGVVKSRCEMEYGCRQLVSVNGVNSLATCGSVKRAAYSMTFVLEIVSSVNKIIRTVEDLF